MKSSQTFILVALVAILSWWLLSTEQQKQVATNNNHHFIDVFINHFTITTTDDNGNIEYTLKADRLEHYNDEDNSQITKPSIHIPQQNGGWLITAESGEINNLNNIIELRNNVMMQQIDTTSSIAITTEALIFDVTKKTLKSTKKVHFNSGSFTLVSNGMLFNGKQKQLKLLSNVSGTYTPTPNISHE